MGGMSGRGATVVGGDDDADRVRLAIDGDPTLGGAPAGSGWPRASSPPAWRPASWTPRGWANS
jgi:hypothetical protein